MQVGLSAKKWHFAFLFFNLDPVFITQQFMSFARAVSFIHHCNQAAIAKIAFKPKSRWSFTCILILIYLYNMKAVSFDVISYLIGFYILQLLAAYFTPKGLQNSEEEEEDEFHQDSLDEEEYEKDLSQSKPLIRSLSELQIWERTTVAFTLGTICSCFRLIQIDAFGPLLMIYFVALVAYTAQRVISKMRKYGYNRSDFHKCRLIV